MKAILILFFAVPSMAGLSDYRGKLDLLNGVGVEGALLRGLHDGNWLAGALKQVAHIEKNGKEIVHLTYLQAWRTDRGDPLLGLSVGYNTGNLAQTINAGLQAVAPNLGLKLPPFVERMAQAVSIEHFAGYRPSHGSDVHDFEYGSGVKVKVPVDEVLAWLKIGL